VPFPIFRLVKNLLRHIEWPREKGRGGGSEKEETFFFGWFFVFLVGGCFVVFWGCGFMGVGSLNVFRSLWRETRQHYACQKIPLGLGAHRSKVVKFETRWSESLRIRFPQRHVRR